MVEAMISDIEQLAARWDAALPPEAGEKIAAYLRELLRWNSHVNLTGAKTLKELVNEHLQDSFVLARFCPPECTVVDVGSGGGLPGIPLGLARPDCRLTLVEPRAKRVAFLRAAVRESGSSSIEVQRGRGEDLSGARYMVAVSRATFPPAEWLALAERIVDTGGIAVVLGAHASDPRIGAASIRDGVSYETSSGAPRWAGAYCFT